MKCRRIRQLVFSWCLAPLFYGVPISCLGAAAVTTPHGDAPVAELDEQDQRYIRLRDALSEYREIERGGGWPMVLDGPVLRRGVSDPTVKLLRQRLVVTNDLKPGNSGGTLFDSDLEAAVRDFQKRHGIAVDGIVGPRTWGALNVPVQRRIEQLRINLERRRRISNDLGSHYIFVNMADFVLKVVKEGRTVLTMKIVVGTPHRQTPLFSASMTYIDFNPFWNIPDRIAREEIVPRARQSGDYLIDQGIRIFSRAEPQDIELAPHQVDWGAVGRGSFPYRLRQDPGPLNPLGQVKFMFPNAFDVYLHDTPARQLFGANVRAFSHGCIRIEKPDLLAAHLLPDLSEQEVRLIMRAGKRRVIHLDKPIPVHLAYFTAWVNKDGSVHFRQDVYRRDSLWKEASR